MDWDDETEATPDTRTTYAYPSTMQQQGCVAFTTETSATVASRRPTKYPCTVTLPDGTTNLIITTEMAAKITKLIDGGIMVRADATPDELTASNYFNCNKHCA